MNRVNYYTGQPVDESVAQLSDPTDNSNQFAFNASEAYNYNFVAPQIPQPQPMPMFQQYQQFPQGQGYMTPPTGFMGAPMNTPYVPWRSQNPNTINRWQQQTYSSFGGYAGAPYMGTGMTQQVGVYNPVIQQPMYFQQQQPQQVQDRVVHVPGYNPFGNPGLLLSNAEELCDQMQVDAMFENEKAMAKREERMQGYFNNNMGGYNYYNNFYGMPYMNNLNYDQNVYNSLVSKIQEMADAAIERRLNFNKNISRMVHNYLGDNVTDEQINTLYEGYTYTIPGTSIKEYEIQDKLYNCVPFDNSGYYQKLDANVTAMYRSLAPAGRNMNEFLYDAGFLILEDKIEKQLHRNRDGSRLYNSDTYHRYLRKYALENELEQHQQKVIKEVEAGNFDNLPTTRMEAVKFLFGDKVAQGFANFEQKMANGYQPIRQIAPPDHLGTPVIMTDEEEADFEMRRNAFIESIYKKETYAERNYRMGVT